MLESEPAHLRHKRKLGDIGMWLFLAALAMLFIAGLLGYVLIRTRVFGQGSLGEVRIQLPHLLWLSTAVIIAASFTLHLAVRAVALERQKEFRQWLWLSLGLGCLFVLIQIPCLVMLLQENFRNLHRAVEIGQRRNALYGFVFFLILLHALHVLGGIIALIRLGMGAARGTYDHEHYGSVRHTVQYWHFVDVVWIVLFGVIWLLG